MVKVSPSLLSCDFSKLREEIRMVERAGCDMLHIDVMDGHFVPNLTFGPVIIQAIKKVATVPLDVHLMITNPEKYYMDYIRSGADYLAFHIEAVPEPKDLLEKIKSQGIKVGIAINPDTRTEKVLPYKNLLDFVVVMTVFPGFGGQKFIEEPLQKIPILKANGIMVEVDGGVKRHNAKKVVDAGADILVSGSGVFCDNDPEGVIKYFKTL